MPKRWRSGPVSLVATMPPIVAASNALSTGSHCPCSASWRFSSRERHAGLDGGGQVAVAMDEQCDRASPCRRPDRRDRGAAPPELRAAAAEHGELSIARGGRERSARAPRRLLGLAQRCARHRRHRSRRRRACPGSNGLATRSSEPLAEPGALRPDARDTGRALRRTAAASAAPCPDCRGAADRARRAPTASRRGRRRENIAACSPSCRRRRRARR